MSVEILSYRPTNQGKKIGFIEVYIPKLGIVYNHLAHLQSGEKRWINFPTYPRETIGDKKLFVPYVQFKQTTHNTYFLEQVNEALKHYCEQNKIILPDVPDLGGKLEGSPF